MQASHTSVDLKTSLLVPPINRPADHLIVPVELAKHIRHCAMLYFDLPKAGTMEHQGTEYRFDIVIVKYTIEWEYVRVVEIF